MPKQRRACRSPLLNAPTSQQAADPHKPAPTATGDRKGCEPLTRTARQTEMASHGGAAQILELGAPSGTATVIELELPDEDAALRMAHKLADETGRRISVRDAEMIVIGNVRPPQIH